MEVVKHPSRIEIEGGWIGISDVWVVLSSAHTCESGSDHAMMEAAYPGAGIEEAWLALVHACGWHLSYSSSPL